MDFEANIPRRKISETREFSIPFRSRSSSHSLQCNCTDPHNSCTYSSPSMASENPSSTPSTAADDSKSKSANSYFPSLSDIKTDDENSSSESEKNDEAHARKQKDPNLSSSPTAAESENSADAGNKSASTSNFARLVAYGLTGMTIDYNGDVLNDSKKSCGKAMGDITEMVGQKIDEDGLIRSAAGEVAGQVTQNYGLQEAVAGMMEAQKRNLGSSENRGNNAKHTGEQERTDTAGAQGKSEELPNIWQGTVGQGPPGNDIHLNVQSTKEGISMSVRIPTMFMKEQQRQFEEEKRNAKDQSS